jgi:hypothetical protein
MNEYDKPTLEQSKKLHDEFESRKVNARIAELAEAMEKARQATIKLRKRRRKRTVIIK